MSIHSRFSRLYPRTISFRLTILCLSAAVIISICISGVLIAHISGLVRNENNTYLDNLLDNLISGTDTIPYKASQIDRILLNHVDIQDILLRSQSPDYTAQDYLHDSEKIAIIINSLSVTDGPFYTSFYSSNGTFLFDGNTSSHPANPNLLYDQWISDHKAEIDSRALFLISPIHSPKEFYGNFKPLMVVRPLKDIVSKKVTAYVVVYADSSAFQTLLLKNLHSISKDIQTGPVLSIRLADTDGVIIASTNRDEYGLEIGQLAAPEQLMSRQSQYSGFTIYIEPSATYLSHALNATLVPILGILAAILLVFGLIIITLLQRMFLPLKNLISNMRLVGRGDFKLRLDETICHDDDMWEVYHGFNHITGKIDNLITNVYEQQLLLKTSQLQSLTYQINPHFLYNTLQTIEAIAEVRDTPEVQTIATSLAQMFRYNLKPENFVSLSDELDHLESYFSIERIRFRNQISFQIDLAPQLHPLPVPKFVLQPIVENSLIHAFRQILNANYHVRITGEIVSNDKLVLHVADNGIGMEPSQVEALNRKLSEAGSAPVIQTKESIGLINVHQRLINCCGAGYGLTIISRANEGTCVNICLPFSPCTDA